MYSLRGWGLKQTRTQNAHPSKLVAISLPKVVGGGIEQQCTDLVMDGNSEWENEIGVKRDHVGRHDKGNRDSFDIAIPFGADGELERLFLEEGGAK